MGFGPIEYWLSNPAWWPFLAFHLWMLVDAIRREEWVWVLFIFVFPVINDILYYFMVYRAAAPATRGFELPGFYDRRRIKELQAQIHHLDKAHHHSQLGDIYFHQGKLTRAEACYRAAMERDPEDIDTRAHLGQCLLRQKNPKAALPLLEKVRDEDLKHDYGYSLMALAETYTALGDDEAALATWLQVLQSHSYARARVQLADLYVKTGRKDDAAGMLREVLSDDVHAPAFQRKRERVWVRRARSLLRSL